MTIKHKIAFGLGTALAGILTFAPLALASEVTGQLNSNGVVSQSSGSQVNGTIAGQNSGSTITGTVTGGSSGSTGGGGGGGGGGGNGPIVATNSGGGASLTSNISGSGTTDYVVYPTNVSSGIVLGASTQAPVNYTNTNAIVPVEEVVAVDTPTDTTLVPTDNSGQVAGVFDSDTGIPNWLWWVMGIVLVLMIAYFAITRSSRDDETGRI